MPDDRRPLTLTPAPSGPLALIKYHLGRVNWPLLIGALIVLLVAAVALAGPELAPHDPLEENAIIRIDGEWTIPPFPALTPGFPLGSDQFGRDLFSRLLWAIRPTMTMVAVVALVRLVLGVVVGLGAGWFGGWIGRAFDGAIGLALSVPVLMVALGAIAAVGIEAGIWAFVIGLSINGWVETARLVREQTRIVKGQLFVEAARALGATDLQVISRHVLRQIMPMVWMLFAFEISGTLMVTAALGFLGYYIGGDVWVLVDDFAARSISGSPELGQMLATSWVRTDEPWAMIAVGSVVFFTVLGFNLLGRGLRQRLSLKRMAQNTLADRAREAVLTPVRQALSTRVARPIGTWVEERIKPSLSRGKGSRWLYPLAGGLLVIVLGGLVWWRLQTTGGSTDQRSATTSIEGPLWAAERRDPQGTLWSQIAGPVAPEVQWTFTDPALTAGKEDAGFSGGPAVSEEGTVYVASKDGTLYALDPAGQVRWQASLPAAAVRTPALGPEDQIYVTDEAGNLSSFDPDGVLQWRFQAPADVFATSGPVVARDGRIYYIVNGGTVQAVSPQGQALWRTRALTGPLFSPPRLSADGRWLFVKNVALDAREGTVQEWETPVQVERYLIGGDGQSYLQSGNEIFQWQLTDASIETGRSATWNHRAFAVRTQGGPTDVGVTPSERVWMLYASNREDTRIVWVDVGGRTVGNAHYAQRETQVIGVDQDATTYTCGLARASGPECLALEPGTEEPLWRLSLDRGTEIGGGALVPGRLYLAMEEGFLYAIGQGQPGQVAQQDQTATPDQQTASSRGPDTQEIQWIFKDASGFSSGPTISDQGNVFVAATGGTLYALNPAGDVLWEATLPAAPVGPPTLSGTGDVYQADKDGNLSAFAADGTPLWRFEPPESKPSTVGPLVGPDGTIYYTIGSSVQAVSPDGQGLWNTRAETFRSYTPLEIDPAGELLFFAEDVFDAREGSLLELTSPVDVDQFLVGRDGETYLRSQNTVIQWRRNGSNVEIVQSAQWNYQGFVSSQAAPEDAGVTEQGTIWLMYTTPWGGSTLIAWVDLEGQIIGTANPEYRYGAAQVAGVRDRDGTAYLCGFKNRPQGYTPATVECIGLVPGSDEPIWQVKVGESKEIKGSALAQGRLYVTSTEGQLYAVGEDQAVEVASSPSPPSQPAAETFEAMGPPTDEIAWTFQDPEGFFSGPALSKDGIAYIASTGGTLYALDPAGDVLWEATLPAAPVGPPALSATGDVYQADKAGDLSAFAPDGTPLWHFESPDDIPSTVGPLVGPDGTIYYTIGSSVQAVSPDGEGLWNARAQTFRPYVPLQLDPQRGLLFYADDIFDLQTQARLELESPVEADQFFVGNDGQLYLRADHTVMQWQLQDGNVEIVQSAQWDYTSFTGRATPPSAAGVTQDGTIWIAYTSWGTAVAWVDLTGQVLGGAHDLMEDDQLIAVLDEDATVYLCGLENQYLGRPTPAYCKAFNPSSAQPLWEVELEKSEKIRGGTLTQGRLYVATDEGILYAIGPGTHEVAQRPAEESTSPAPSPPEEEQDQAPVSISPEPTPAPTALPADTWMAGETFTYTLPIVNHGPSDAPGVVVTDTLPSGVRLVSATSSQGGGCLGTEGAVVCNLGDLPNGASAAITVVVSIETTTSGTITHTAIVASRASDPDRADNRLDRPTYVRGAANLAVTQLARPDPAIAGGPLTYTVNITNNGPGEATNVSLSGTLPVSTTLISTSGSQEVDCSLEPENPRTYRCTLGSLFSGAGITLTLVVDVDPAAPEFLRHAVTVAADEPDPEPLDDTSVTETPVTTEADLTISR